MRQIPARIVQIRYNTESDGRSLCWRLLIDGKEKLVNEIQIEKPCRTTADWLEDRQTIKHHITVEDCVVYIEADTKVARIL